MKIVNAFDFVLNLFCVVFLPLQIFESKGTLPRFKQHICIATSINIEYHTLILISGLGLVPIYDFKPNPNPKATTTEI